MTPASTEDRLRLLRFVCSFAWADLEIDTAEREYVRELAHKLELSPAEAARVEHWLEVPPPAEDIDPFDIPLDQRQAVLAAAAGMIRADGVVDRREIESFVLLESLIGALDLPPAEG